MRKWHIRWKEKGIEFYATAFDEATAQAEFTLRKASRRAYDVVMEEEDLDAEDLSRRLEDAVYESRKNFEKKRAYGTIAYRFRLALEEIVRMTFPSDPVHVVAREALAWRSSSDPVHVPAREVWRNSNGGGVPRTAAEEIGDMLSEADRLRRVIRLGGAAYRMLRASMGIPGGIDPDEEKEVVLAAIEWWKGKRPIGWTEEEHRNELAINTNTVAESKLAEAVARILTRGFPESSSAG